MKLTEIEKNVILVALDHMEKQILVVKHLVLDLHLFGEDLWQEKLDACKTIKTKLKSYE